MIIVDERFAQREGKGSESAGNIATIQITLRKESIMVVYQFSYEWPVRNGHTGHVEVVLDIGRWIDVKSNVVPWHQSEISLVVRSRVNLFQHVSFLLLSRFSVRARKVEVAQIRLSFLPIYRISFPGYKDFTQRWLVNGAGLFWDLRGAGFVDQGAMLFQLRCDYGRHIHHSLSHRGIRRVFKERADLVCWQGRSILDFQDGGLANRAYQALEFGWV